MGRGGGGGNNDESLDGIFKNAQKTFGTSSSFRSVSFRSDVIGFNISNQQF